MANNKRVLIIVWKWRVDYNDLVNVENTDDTKIKCLKYNNSQIDELIKEVSNISSEKIILLLHMGEENNFSESDKNKIKQGIKQNVKCYLFKGGRGDKIYFNNSVNDKLNNGLLDQGGDFFQESDYKVLENKSIKEKNFEFVWDWYWNWNKLDIENHKKAIINLWLPLAIDIQGLSEVQNDEKKAKEYFEEIKKETAYLELLKSFPKDDEFQRLKEIEQTLKKNEETKPYADFNPVSLVKEIIKDSSTFTVIKENTAKYLEKEINGKPNPHFLPNWLQEVVNIIDKKIEESSKLVEEK